MHKIYLCQSPYFHSMFNGSKWKEANESCIEISIPDANINEKSLNIAFGSFYKEDIEIAPIEVVSVLASASLLSLEGLIQQCASIMIENINSHSVLAYYEASLTYGVKQVEEKAFKWLCMNLMGSAEIKLNQISVELMEKILDSDDLLIVQVETDLYSLCKKWLYFQLNPTKTSLLNSKSLINTCNEYFKMYMGSSEEEGSLLELEDMRKYASVFRKIRLNHLLYDLSSFRLLKSDCIVPFGWLQPCFYANWLNLLFVDQERHSHEFEIDKADFESGCMRFGRVLVNESVVTWRWVSYF